MSEVRRHERQTASGKRTTVRHHTRGGDKGRTRREDEAEAAREAWADRTAPHVSSLPPAEPVARDEAWWDDDEPRQEEWMAGDDADEVEHEGHTFKVNHVPAYQPQGDHDFAKDDGEPSDAFKAMGLDGPEFRRLSALRGAGYDGPVDQDGNPTDHKALKKTRKALEREQVRNQIRFCQAPTIADRDAAEAEHQVLNEKLKAVQDPRQAQREERARQANRNLYKKLSGE